MNLLHMTFRLPLDVLDEIDGIAASRRRSGLARRDANRSAVIVDLLKNALAAMKENNR